MMRCGQARRRVLASRDEPLALAARLELDEHLAGCPACRALDEVDAGLEEGLAAQPEPPVEQVDLERAVRAVRGRIDALAPTAAERARPPFLPRTSALLAAAALVLLLGGLAYLLRGAVLGDADRGDRARREEQLADAAPALVEPQEGASSEPGEASAQPLPEPEPIDVQRLERTRAQLREVLVEAAAAWPQGREDATALVARIEERTRGLEADGWPLVRLAERFVHDPEVPVAVAAVRYLGARGDRLALRLLTRRLQNASAEEPTASELRRQVVLGLRDAGEPGLEGLGLALSDARLRPTALAAVVAVGGEGAASVLERALAQDARGGDHVARAAEVLNGLGALGQPGLDALVRLGSRGRAPLEALATALTRVRGGRELLAARLERPASEREVDILVELAGRLQLEQALEWIAARCVEREHRAASLRGLAHLDGAATLERLIELGESGRVPEDEVQTTLSAAEALRPGRLAAHVGELASRQDVVALRRLLRTLLEGEDALAAPALARLAACPLLDEDERVWAALALGELGSTDELAALRDLLAGLRSPDKLLASACVLSVHQLGGPPAVRAALGGSSAEPALQILTRRDRAGSTAAPLFKLARELEPWLDAPDTDRPRTTP